MINLFEASETRAKIYEIARERWGTGWGRLSDEQQAVEVESALLRWYLGQDDPDHAHARDALLAVLVTG